MLYYPGLHEIRPLIQRVMDQNPHLKSRAEKAEQLLLNFDLRYRSGWQVQSQSTANEWYVVDYDSCACYDYQSGQGNRINDRVFCKRL